ncbi:MAG: alpha/beta hydrolase fold domain-containing protein [Hyphomonas sp.]|nr:alpha/beta hydrolase fold domain-containing protein [Hyphomonas sp.]
MIHRSVRRAGYALLGFVLAACATPGEAETLANESGGLTVQSDIVYGTGIVDASTAPHERNLTLDAYLPAAGGLSPSPAIIMAFGGAFHRGSKGDFHFIEDGAQDSSMANYCRMFAEHGIACFAIDYRLVPEDPAFPEAARDAVTVPKALLEDPGAMARIALVRQRMNLPPLDATSREQYWSTTFAAAWDFNAALDYVRRNAAQFGVDPDRIAVGGFSAGAISAINLAYGIGAPVSAVVSISGTIWGYDVTQTAHSGEPPLLLLAGQQDLAGIRWGSSELARQFPAKGVHVETAWVPGFGHFYPMGATTLGSGFTKQSVEERILAFLDSTSPAATHP